jgi:hypothetical protein
MSDLNGRRVLSPFRFQGECIKPYSANSPRYLSLIIQTFVTIYLFPAQTNYAPFVRFNPLIKMRPHSPKMGYLIPNMHEFPTFNKMERVTRIELALSGWKPGVLPLNYTLNY